MRKVVAGFFVWLGFWLVVPAAQAATFYWVGDDGAATTNTSNWTLTNPLSCGPGDAAVLPGPLDHVVFDADCDNGAVITSNMTVLTLTMQAGYRGTVRQLPATTVTVDSFDQVGGIYNTSGGSLVIGRATSGAVPTLVPTPLPLVGQLAEPVLKAFGALPDKGVGIGLTALATTASLATLASLPGIWSTVLLDLVRGLFPLVGPLRNRRRPVGRVLNELDGMPVGGALVHIFDVATSRLRETIVTGPDGSFGTILPPGTYLFSARKPGYTPVFSGSAALLFPGELVATEQPITVQEEGTVVPLVFFMRRMVPYSLYEWGRARLLRWGQTLRIGLARVSLPLLLGGAALNVVALLRRPSLLLFGVTILYLVFLSLELFISRRFRRAFGHVMDAVVKKPVALASIRLIEPATKRIIQTRVTTAGGQYLMLAPRGDYTLQFAHPRYQALEQGVAIRPAGGSPVVLDASLTPRQAN